MNICHQGVYDAFKIVYTRNLSPSKQKIWFDYLNGADTGFGRPGHQETIFSISNELTQSGVHRVHFLDELIELIPSSICRFDKRLQDITVEADGRLVMKFFDQLTDNADLLSGVMASHLNSCKLLRTWTAQTLSAFDRSPPPPPPTSPAPRSQCTECCCDHPRA